MTTVRFNIFSGTDKGLVRNQNEDYHSYCANLSEKPLEWSFSTCINHVRPGPIGSLLLLTDGIGGNKAGDVASKLTVESIKSIFSKLEKAPDSDQIPSFLEKVIIETNEKVIEYQENFPDTYGMGTTLIIGWVTRGQLHLSWIGDSRAYIFNPKTGLHQLSKDHSLVQRLVDQGEITNEQAFFHPHSNIITQSLGDRTRIPKPGYKSITLQGDDRILLCSDGLNNMLQNHALKTILEHFSDTEQCGVELISSANKAGGRDNISLILFDVIPE